MNSEPLISIITISYNAVNLIDRTISSVINQSYKNVEYIIIDGGSTDGTIDIIKKNKENLVYWVSEHDKGIYDAMNKGLRKAKGRWVNFMNAGDQFSSLNVLESLFLNCKFTSDILYGNTIRLYKDNDVPVSCYPFFLKKRIAPMGICHQSIFIKTSIAKKEYFDTKLEIVADYKMMYRAIENGASTKDTNVFISSIDPYGVSQTSPFRLNFEIASFRNESIVHKVLFVFKSILKHYLSVLYNIIKSY
jgi:glycosyltransferase involved in cell wall biosynthesis